VSVLTEAGLRQQLRCQDLAAMTDFTAPAGTIVTPAAKAWLIDHKLGLVVGERRVLRGPNSPPAARPGPDDRPGAGRPAGTSRPGGSGATGSRPIGSGSAASGSSGSGPDGLEPSPAAPVSALPEFRAPAHYTVLNGGQLETKPEHMTALRGDLLVMKDHPAIALRGQLDSLEAAILEAQVVFRRLGLEPGVAELGQVLRYVKNLLRAEVLEEPLGQISLFGWDDAELRARSHRPQDYYGLPHFATSVDDGEAVVRLNSLRTQAREVELAAYNAFKRSDGRPPEREDLILALNRLSSAFYLMMFKAKAKEYQS
jgi:ethanolamine utilization cobalamin adenosyltransferase